MPTITLRPNGAGDLSEATPTGAPTNWECVDESVSDGDTSFVFLANSTRSDLYSLPASGIPPNATINSVTVHLLGRYGSGVARLTGKTVTPRIKEGGVIINGTSFTLNSGYLLTSNSWAVRPSTGQPWAADSLAALQIGFTATSNNTIACRISQVYVVVDYSLASTTITTNALLIAGN